MVVGTGRILNRASLEEFHYIAHFDNLPSIFQGGILSHAKAGAHKPTSVASQDVQNRRARRKVPRGRRLHQYANLYFTARNPMMYVLRHNHADLAVLAVDIAVLDIPGAVLADGNAASDPTAFYASPAGLGNLDGNAIFAVDWTDQDIFEYWYKKRVKCAEVLIPDEVPPEFITGAYVSSQGSLNRFNSLGLGLNASVHESLFFRP